MTTEEVKRLLEQYQEQSKTIYVYGVLASELDKETLLCALALASNDISKLRRNTALDKKTKQLVGENRG